MPPIYRLNLWMVFRDYLGQWIITPLLFADNWSRYGDGLACTLLWVNQGENTIRIKIEKKYNSKKEHFALEQFKTGYHLDAPDTLTIVITSSSASL